MKRKSQIWSIDSIIAIVIFITTIVIFIVYLSTTDSSLTAEDVQRESNIITQLIGISEDTVQATRGSRHLSFVSGPNINVDNLRRIQEHTYEQLRESFGIRSNFCIYLEDMQTNIINISLLTNSSEGVGIGHNGTRYIDSNGNIIPLC